MVTSKTSAPSMDPADPPVPASCDVVVIGAGQAGLAVGYHLARRGLHFVILDAGARIGDAWRSRWDSLRLFTPAHCDGLDGMPFPGDPRGMPTKDEMADYLETYAGRFDLPVRTGARVERVVRRGARFGVVVDGVEIDAGQVVVAMGSYQRPRIPAFAAELDPSILQLTAREYRSPAQLRPGGVLLVGAGNSGIEIGLDVAEGRPTWLAGRHPGHLPFRIDGWLGRWVLGPLFLRVLFHYVATVRTPIGRRMRPAFVGQGGLWIRSKPADARRAGIDCVPRVTGVQDGRPVLEDGRILDPANVIWCTGYDPGFSWLELPVLGEDGEPRHEAGVSTDVPGLYFVGLQFLYAVSSTMIRGVSRDAARVVRALTRRA